MGAWEIFDIFSSFICLYYIATVTLSDSFKLYHFLAKEVCFSSLLC